MNNLELAVQFFLQLAVILVFCRLVGFLAARLGQPQVVAEMIAGVLLGPSLFGLLAPDTQAWLFPWDESQGSRDTQSYLFPASQLGLALYMFLVALEFDVEKRHAMAREAMALLTGIASRLADEGLPCRMVSAVGFRFCQRWAYCLLP